MLGIAGKPLARAYASSAVMVTLDQLRFPRDGIGGGVTGGSRPNRGSTGFSASMRNQPAGPLGLEPPIIAVRVRPANPTYKRSSPTIVRMTGSFTALTSPLGRRLPSLPQPAGTAATSRLGQRCTISLHRSTPASMADALSPS